MNAADALREALAEVFERHQYALGCDGIVSDGDWAWLQCTCGWRENYEMPEDDIRHAERRWEAHQADALAEAVARDWLPTLVDDEAAVEQIARAYYKDQAYEDELPWDDDAHDDRDIYRSAARVLLRSLPAALYAEGGDR